ncbi:SMAD/FHA domain [Pseudocohnilembus persalinus]|uniref:SMAD/FHA domain n=1 Tax=Pseudocohnilembus persalinus TaxID=266149 RepID=A0A0V0R4B2_PSEPJ|nr:SMAD/FHA domain [Pseudocohnilembus persalinus]|eukprot:KRX09048.1 SMAD/FHA domain [Pseudocohnilembus persalinus]
MGSCTSKQQNKQFIPYKVAITTKMWTKNQHNLFDFECKDVKTNTYEVQNSGKLIQVRLKQLHQKQQEQQKRDEEKQINNDIDNDNDNQENLNISDININDENQNYQQDQVPQNLQNAQQNQQKVDGKIEEKKKEKQLKPPEKEDEIVNIQQNECVVEPHHEVLKYTYNKNEFYIKQTPYQIEDDKDDSTQLWYVIRDQNNNNQQGLQFDKRMKLQIGDHIKLGRANLRIKEFVIQNESSQMNEDDHPLKTEGQDLEDTIQAGDKHCCRICLSEGSNLINPLISPCDCNGSMKYLHLKCIQKWVERQFKIKTYNNNHITVYFWKKLKCELCKTPFKTELQFNDIIYSIINIPKPKGSYLMLQLKGSDKKQERGIFIVDLSVKDTLKIGRTHDCDIKLNDISVSRVHAILQLQNNELYIEDYGSKFGTLVLLQDKLVLEPVLKKQYLIQCGRTLVTMEFQKATKQKSLVDQYTNKNNLPPGITIKQMDFNQINKEVKLEQIKQHRIELEKQAEKRKLAFY